jgi:uncharacterized membrane protein YgdD (TMEM256/DUF423 family)
MNQTTKTFAFYGSIFMALAVAFGAFGAHGLKSMISPDMLVIFHTGVEYHFYHALGLFAVAFVAHSNDTKQVKIAGYLMIFGILIFSGSLYILSITGIKWLGAITPIGGTGFIVAWVMLALALRKS